MPIPGIAAMIWNRIADFLSEVWSIRIARSRAIRRRAVGFQEPEMRWCYLYTEQHEQSLTFRLRVFSSGLSIR